MPLERFVCNLVLPLHFVAQVASLERNSNRRRHGFFISSLAHHSIPLALHMRMAKWAEPNLIQRCRHRRHRCCCRRRRRRFRVMTLLITLYLSSD